MHDIGVTLSYTDMENILNFYKLVKDGTLIDEMKNYIYSFIKYYDILKNDLFNEYKTIFTERMKNTQRFYMKVNLYKCQLCCFMEKYVYV
ncbi:Plasmodium exported protein, unknown function [Plasmodium reichenowi]|uniref:Plasmodium RESA N-terminal domain-containing protein n=1 Tax=Plasmodium reichenowi TaxID=5854 RepID=A0A2P9DCB1_PLARE|nr:Plasmodium exported protein, unknown function [Plasmodium reichenowi]